VLILACKLAVVAAIALIDIYYQCFSHNVTPIP